MTIIIIIIIIIIMSSSSSSSSSIMIMMMIISMITTMITSISGKDKGGPSKGGFSNNRLVSWIIYYLYAHNMNFITQIHIRIWQSSIIQEHTFTMTTFVLRQTYASPNLLVA